MRLDAAIAQQVEHVIGNDEVMGPNPISSSKKKKRTSCPLFLFLVLLRGFGGEAVLNDRPVDFQIRGRPSRAVRGENRIPLAAPKNIERVLALSFLFS